MQYLTWKETLCFFMGKLLRVLQDMHACLRGLTCNLKLKNSGYEKLYRKSLWIDIFHIQIHTEKYVWGP